MRQLYIAGTAAYPVAAADYMALSNGAIGIFNNKGTLIKTALSAETDYVSIVLGRGANKQPLITDMVNIKSLSVTKGSYIAATKFTAKVTIPAPKVNKDYTVMVVKKGMVFNERNTWTFTERARESDTATTIADKIVKVCNANTVNSEMTAVNAAGVITFTAATIGKDYNIVCADELFGTLVTDVTQGIAAYGDAAYVEELASVAAAGKGFEYTAQEGKDIYPGYPEKVASPSYSIYTLRFATPSKYKPVDFDQVFQILQLAVPTGSGQITTLDTIFGITAP